MQQREWVFEGIAPLKYLNPCNKNRRASLAHLLSDYFVGKSLSLVSCSPAELTSVSASNPEFHYTKLYLQSAEFSSHFQQEQFGFPINTFSAVLVCRIHQW